MYDELFLLKITLAYLTFAILNLYKKNYFLLLSMLSLHDKSCLFTE